MDKMYYLTHNVGKVKYLLSYHDGVQTHRDGSPFFGAETFKNKKKLEKRISDLQKEGYRYKS